MSGKRLFLILVGCGVMLLLASVLRWGSQPVFQAMGVKAMSPVFLDLHTITAGAESHATGLDPLYENPRDPFGRPLNYPRIWQGLFYFHIDQGDTLVLGTLLILVFLLSLCLFPGTMDRTTAVLLALALFSPAVLLGVERANVDLLIFAILSGAVYCTTKSPAAAAFLLQAGVFLKLYPLAGLGMLLGSGRKKFFLLAGLVGAVSLVYFIFTLDDLAQIQQATQKGIRLAYGFEVLPMAMARFHPSWRQAASVAAGLLVVLVAAAALWTRPSVATAECNSTDQRLAAFRLGSGIYLGTFLLGSNFNYRLSFLLFTIPQLVHWCRQAGSPPTRRALVAVAAVMVSLWSQFFARFPDSSPLAQGLFLVDEVANWLVFALLLQLLYGSLPDWLLPGKDLLKKAGVRY
jgi:hypothetical protein